MELTFPLAAGVVAAGAAIGVFSALLGVGGGLIMVPFMVLALGLEQHTAEGTSLLAIVPIALIGVVSHRAEGHGSLRMAAFLAVGGVVGAYLGARLALRLDDDVLEAVFGALLCATGLHIVYSGWRNRRT